MPEKTTNTIEITEDLIINNVEDIRSEFLGYVKNSDKLEIVLTVVKDIDISGLQLLISLWVECKNSGKDIHFLGSFNKSFCGKINKIAFAPSILNNGVDLQNFINETV